VFNCYLLHSGKMNHLRIFEIGKEKELLDEMVKINGPFDDNSKKLASRFIENGIKSFNISTKDLTGITFRDEKGYTAHIYPGIK
jgi:hypothetical protein